jgi:hypothetical protein
MYRTAAELDARASALRALEETGVPSLVAGAYAMFEYTSIFRDTKDLDIFLRRRDLDSALLALEAAGFRTELTDPLWIAKAFCGEYFVDLIFSSGNGVAVVDDLWFQHAQRGQVMGVPCLLAPVEEIIWSKAFVNERERFDGADVVHLIRACGHRMDWGRLLARFDRYWEVLFAHLLFYRFVYPGERNQVPLWVTRELSARAAQDRCEHSPTLCRGNLISRVQYQHDYLQLGLEDGRLWDERERAEENGGDERRVEPLSPGSGG